MNKNMLKKNKGGGVSQSRSHIRVLLHFQVAQVEKFSESSGLGISLEASRGHHYIRSVLPEGPVGRCGQLFSGDELVEVKLGAGLGI